MYGFHGRLAPRGPKHRAKSLAQSRAVARVAIPLGALGLHEPALRLCAAGRVDPFLLANPLIR